MWRPLHAAGLQILQVRTLQRLTWLVHGFSTRLGGVSHLETASGGSGVLNLGFTPWDSRANVAVNRARLLSALGAEQMKLCPLRQIHSDVTRAFDAHSEQAPQGDASITRRSGLLLAVQTADCVPILLVDTKRRAVAAVHAGWCGTLKRITAKALGRMQMSFGTQPSDVLAVLGPAIGRCCYGVGPEVAQAYTAQFARAREWFEGSFDRAASSEQPNPLKWLNRTAPGHHPPPPRVHLDLKAANRWQLLDRGVKPSNILTSELCTACRPDLLFSHRREDGRTGRLMAVVGIRA